MPWGRVAGKVPNKMGMLVDSGLKMHQLCDQEGQWHVGLHQKYCGQQYEGSDCLLVGRTAETHLEQRVQVWAPHNRKGIELLEYVQRRGIRLMKGLENSNSEEHMEEMGVVNFEETEGRDHCNLLLPERRLQRRSFWFLFSGKSYRMWGNHLKPCPGKFRSDIQKNLFFNMFWFESKQCVNSTQMFWLLLSDGSAPVGAFIVQQELGWGQYRCLNEVRVPP